MIKVVNKHKHTPTSDDIYIGRGSVLGNPFTHLKLSKTTATYQTETREEAIELHKKYLDERIEAGDREICNELNRIYRQALDGNVNLVCYCKDLSCHGDYIKELIDSKLR